jgi:hypothetical protein
MHQPPFIQSGDIFTLSDFNRGLLSSLARLEVPQTLNRAQLKEYIKLAQEGIATMGESSHAGVATQMLAELDTHLNGS